MRHWTLKTRGHLPIGLDMGHHSIKMIQLAGNGEQISVIAANKVVLDPRIAGDADKRREFVVTTIRQMLANGSFRGRNVVSCLPSEKLRITSVRVGEAESARIRQVLRKEASQRFGLDPEKDAIHYLVAGNVRQGDEIKNELILLATDNDTIRGHIETLEAAQLRPVGIDTVPCALFRGFERSLRRQEDRSSSHVFVDVGSRFTTVVFARGEKISFVKQIAIGGENFTREIASKLGINVNEAELLRRKLRTERSINRSTGTLAPASDQDTTGTDDRVHTNGVSKGGTGLDVSTQQVMVDAMRTVAEELAREISLCFRYYTVTFRGKRVERAVFSGGEAHERISLNVLRRQLSVEIEVAQPLRGFDISSERTIVDFDSDRRGWLCEWAVAVGLGLKWYNEGAKGEKEHLEAAGVTGKGDSYEGH